MNAQSVITGPGYNNVPRAKLSNKMRLAAVLMASGYTVPETANYLGLNKAHLAVVNRSGLFQAEVEKVRIKFIDKMVTELRDGLIAEGKKSLDTVVEVRDQPMNFKTAGEKRRAAQFIVEKVLGKQGEPSEGNKGNQTQVNIVISQDEAKHLDSVITEFEEL